MPEVFSSDAFILGACCGTLLLGVLLLLTRVSYRQVLLSCARQKTAERLPDGRFYYLVHESEYNQWKLEELKREQQPPLSQQERTVAVRWDEGLQCWLKPDGTPAHPELDVTGQPKLELTIMEKAALDVLNTVKAWADSDRSTPFPEEAHIGADMVLGLAQLRRKGVR